MIVVAIDIGGTFTDLIGFDDEARRFRAGQEPDHAGTSWCRASSTASARAASRPTAIDELIHGSTIAINTLIERKGAKTGLIVTRGTRDVYIIGRGNRPEAYNLFFHRHRPLVPRALTREVDERVCWPPARCTSRSTARASPDACQALAGEGVEAVAVCFLHSYANPEHERVAGEMIREALPDAYLSLSHDILREYREFERMSTTVVNAYIGPKVGGYVASLKSSLGGIGFRGDLSIMRSNGGVMTPEVATSAGGDDGVRPGRRHHRLGAGRAARSASPTSSPSTWAAPPPRRAWSATASRRWRPATTSAAMPAAIR